MTNITIEFSACSCIEEARKVYRALSKKHHPDLGGSTELMKSVNAAFEQWTQKKCTLEDQKIEQALAQAIQDILTAGLPESVTIELIGAWIWLGGDTKPHKEKLKELGYKWHNKRKLWFWHSGKTRKSYNKKDNIEEIKSKYGCKTFNRHGALAI